MADPYSFGWGEYAPWFRAAALNGLPNYAFDTVAGRFVMLLFLGTTSFGPSAEALELIRRHRQVFDDDSACFFGVTTDPKDVESGAIAQELPGIRYFLDYDGSVSRLYGAQLKSGYRPHWLVLDPALRLVGRFPLEQGEAAFEVLKSSVGAVSEAKWAPVLEVTNVFEPQLCDRLIRLYEEDGGQVSGFMREVDGKTVLVTDPAHKQRRDFEIPDEDLRKAISSRINARLRPAIEKAFQFKPTRVERYIVGCYQAGAGHFRPHRDNTTKGTAHRKFAVTINLNADAYDGGDLRFPEFGRKTYRAPTGGAIVFSCSLLHEATPVTRGTRYAFLPFLYDEEGASLRERNNPHLGEGVGEYRSSRADKA